MTINKLLNALHLKVKDRNIFLEAFTHSTFVNENRKGKDYQRLEFLGDAIIDMLVAKYIYQTHPTLEEGDMSLLRSKVVSTKNLASIAQKLGLSEYIRFGRSSEKLKNNAKINADVFESLCAAIFLNSGISVLNKFLKSNIFVQIDQLVGTEIRNPKTLLQEFLQAESRGVVKYNVRYNKNTKLFTAVVTHENKVFGKGSGKSKKEAETNAATQALSRTLNIRG